MARLTDEQYESIRQSWIDVFDERFGHMDFWRLSKKWKRIRYKQMADIIISDLKWAMESDITEEKESK